MNRLTIQSKVDNCLMVDKQLIVKLEREGRKVVDVVYVACRS
jgi:hypothetical protein